MARSKWKLCYFDYSIWRKIKKIKENKIKKFSRISYSRSSYIPISYLYKTILIHKGSRIMRVMIDSLKVGFKIGEFSFTRKPFHYPTKKTKKKNNILIRR